VASLAISSLLSDLTTLRGASGARLQVYASLLPALIREAAQQGHTVANPASLTAVEAQGLADVATLALDDVPDDGVAAPHPLGESGTLAARLAGPGTKAQLRQLAGFLAAGDAIVVA
jgi:hypothetical protein